MKILVTGGAGFIGVNFIKYTLSNTKNIIINIDKLTYSGNLTSLREIEKNKNYFFYKSDIGDIKLISKILKKHKPDKIINFAAETHVDRSIQNPITFLNSNIISFMNFLETSKKYWQELSDSESSKFRFLQISTDEVYGSLKKNEKSFTENSPYKPNSPYAASKASSDLLARSYFKTYNMPIIITNCSNNYGPYQFPEKLIPLTINNIIENKNIPIYGDGTQIRDWIHVEDHIKALTKILEKGTIGEKFNIGGSSEITNIELVTLICETMDLENKKFRLSRPKNINSYLDLITFVDDRKGHDFRYSINNKKIIDVINWYPKKNFKKALKETILWYLENKEWMDNIKSGVYKN